MDSLYEKIKQDNEKRRKSLTEEENNKVTEFDKKYQVYKNRELKYNSLEDYYDDIYYENHLLGLYKTYHSSYSHGKKISSSDIPVNIKPYIREMIDFYCDKMINMKEEITELTK